MKKVLEKSAIEQAEYFCDKHPNVECFSQLKTISWYGSCYDMTGIEIHLCDECLEETYNILEEKFKIKPKDIEI